MVRTWWSNRWIFGAYVALALGSSACVGDGDGGDPGGDPECKTGDQGCACYPNGTCNDNWTCFSKLCVDATTLDDDEADEDDPEEDDAEERDTEDGGGQSPSADEGEGTNDPPEADDADDTLTASDDSESEAPDPDDTDPDAPDSSDPDQATDSTDDTPDMTPDVDTIPFEETPVGIHGQLHVDGTKLTDEHGVVTQLKGISSMWLNWEPTGYATSLGGLRWMRDEWKLQVFRVAMGIAEQPGDGAYLEDPEAAKRKVRAIVDNAITLGVYVIIDWHDHHAEDNLAEAEAFFSEMAEEYAGVPNVLYEIYNEPLAVDWDTELRPYHTAVTAAIREHDNDNVIIMGTPNWSQDVDIAALNPVVGTNLMYTLHFYACDHTEALRAKAVTALANQLPIFVTEWGATPADGGSETPLVCEAEAMAWHEWMDVEKISWAAWKLDGCADSSCLFTSRSVPVDGGWTAEMLNGHAPFVISRLQAASEPIEPDPDVPPPNDCEPTGSCVTADRTYCDPEGNLMDADCSGCALILGCTDCCEDIGYFGARDTQTTFTVDQSLVTSFTQNAEQIAIEASFTAGLQTAAIAISLASAVAIDPYAVLLSLAADGGDAYVTLENGSAGCLYPLVESTDGLVALDPLYSNCWGSALPGDPVSQINVRVDSVAAGDAALAFAGITW